MNPKRMYLEDDLSPLIDWLKEKPLGQCHILVGGSNDALPLIMKSVTAHGIDFAKWVVAKLESGELVIKSIPERLELPIGIIVEGE